MSVRDLTARSSQAKSDISEEALERGKTIYAKIVDDHDADELRNLKLLAEASIKMTRPTEVKPVEPRLPRSASRLLAAFVATFSR